MPDETLALALALRESERRICARIAAQQEGEIFRELESIARQERRADDALMAAEVAREKLALGIK